MIGGAAAFAHESGHESSETRVTEKLDNEPGGAQRAAIHGIAHRCSDIAALTASLVLRQCRSFKPFVVSRSGATYPPPHEVPFEHWPAMEAQRER
jgi:hypothetical protein